MNTKGSVTIRLFGERVSTKHASIEWRSNGFWLADIGSTNGTRVNGERIAEARRLLDGDLVHLGRTGFVAQLNG